MGTRTPAAPPGPALTPLPCDGFDRSQMKPTLGAALLALVFDYPLHACIFGFLRWAAPLLQLGKYFVVTRYDDVLEVLSRDRDFAVPWAAKMEELTDGENFVLGMPRGARYKQSYEQLATAFPREDVTRIVQPRAGQISEDKLAGIRRMDVIQDLMWAVPTQLTGEYYGIPIADAKEFAFWTVAVSRYLFGPPSAGPDDLARVAAGCLRAAIRQGIARAKAGANKGAVLPRLIEAQRRTPDIMTDEVITAQLFGMVLGFIPTNLIASGNIIDTLLRFPEFMAQARAAAFADDDQRLWLCLQEALRFRFINPGTWRVCAARTTIAAGTSRATVVPAGAILLVSAQSAMFDRREIELPRQFNPNRPPEDYLTFGYGQHWCIGAYIAMAQITATFKALLLKKGLRRADGADGRLRRITIYPAYMAVEFGS